MLTILYKIIYIFVKYLKKFNESKVPSKTDKDFVHSDLFHNIIRYGISNNYTINPDGSIDVDNNVSLSGRVRMESIIGDKLTKLPIKFNKVTGSFYCSNNQLTSLEDSPKEVGGDFYCQDNQLTSLEGSPKSVDGDFICRDNQLTSLQGAPKKVGGDFYCSRNELTSLEGFPESVGGNFHCQDNQITDFRGVPEFFEGLFYCEENPIEQIYRLFIKEDKHINDLNLLFGLDGLSKCIRWINEFDVIQGNKVIMDRLEEVFYQLGMDVPENINLPSYEII
jgi:hypothetical protein